MRYYVSREFHGLVATGRWPKSKTGAIKESIKKWETLLGILVKSGSQRDMVKDGGGATCALCQRLKRDNDYACRDCPICKKTKAVYCLGTPYEIFHDARSNGYRDMAIQAAKDEIAFLKGLL